jgi:hypothetical protein
MPDTILTFYLVAMCVLALAWWLTCRGVFRRLRERHPAKAAALFGTPQRRKNELDRLFALLGFLFENQAALGDTRLLVGCVLMKLYPILFLVVLLAMMYTPMFLRLG